MILFGASGHAKVIIDILEKSGKRIDYLVDGNPDLDALMDYEVIHDSEFRTPAQSPVIISIGNNAIRQKLAQLYAKEDFAIARHPSVITGKGVSVGQGTVLMAGAVINSDTSVGSHVIINTCASVDHDCLVGDFAHIAPNSTLCGGVSIGKGTWVGAGATIIPGVKVGDWAVIGAGAVVLNDVPDGMTVVGNPAKILRRMPEEKERIWLSPPHMGGKEEDFVSEAFRTNWIAPLGANVDGFEKDLQDYTGVAHAASLVSGTAAIHLALIILGVERGDEVLVSTFTFSGTINPVLYQGATPIMVDSESKTWNMDPDLLEEAILDRIEKTGKAPKAAVIVHLYGMPAQIDRLVAVCKKYKVAIIEDAAEALGSHYKGQMLGSFGDFGILSFNGNKIITTSGGGALLSDNKEWIERARFLSTQARDPAPHYQHSVIGYNYRMSNVLAGIGRGQMLVLDQWVAKRRQNHQFYKEVLGHKDGVTILTEPDEDYFSNHWLTSIQIDPEVAGVDRETVRLGMQEQNIECRPLWKPMHRQPAYEKHPYYGNGTSDKLFKNGLCLPSGSSLSEENYERIKNTIKGFFINFQ